MRVEPAVTAAGLTRTFYDPADVRLVAEVVFEESAVRDRERKPQLYAAAGIPCFWRIEELRDRRFRPLWPVPITRTPS
jgi:Uma2 family endonuclease